MVLWEAVLSPALQVLFDKLASGADDIIDFLQSCNISDFLLEELKVAYFTNAALLDDAETKQFNNPAVETWLGLLKEAVFAAEDLLDELATEALRKQLGNNHQVTWSLIPSYFTRSNDNCHQGLDSRIAMIINRLNCIAKQKSVLGLKEDGGVKHRAGPRRSVTTPSIVESRIFGRDHDRDEIIKSLFAEDDNEEEIGGREVCILGMGGVGKTVVAQLVFNDRRVDDFFDVKAWACVSEQFNLVDLTKSILESVTDKPWETTNLELLQTSLCKNLNKKKFLIVLDDVWTENYEEWCKLRSPFLVGAPGSRIILTTRNESVLSVTRTCKLPYRLSEVSDDACWSLLSHHAFQGKSQSCSSSPELEVVGREIASKCKGLPLAAITLGRILRSKEEVEHWYQILRRRNFWDFSSRQSSILPTLLLSYYHLPANLRRCFAYCSIFPKGYEFEVEKLVRLWMAEGFVQQGEEDTTMENLGMEYFNELLSRSFFRKSTSSNEQPCYVMHDSINDLARFVSRKTCVSLESKPDLQDHVFSDKVRHFSYVRGKYDVYKKFEALSGSEWVRTFLPLPPEEAGFCYLSSKVVKDLLPRLRCLRVLSLSGYCIEELPESIGQFKHLRYLDLSCTAIKALPSSICTLFNLQTLMLNDCDALNELPENLTDLINLRYFDISGSGVQDMPLGMGKLRNLQVLPEFVVGSEIGEMRSLLHLQGKVTLSRLENVVNAWDARKANLTTKKGIKELVLEWTSNFNELQDHNIQTAVFEMLQPHQFLQIIRISYFNGLKFPTWLGDPFFSNMVMMSLAHCKKCSCLPPFGQLPSLRELHIEGLASVESVGIEFYGENINGKPFPSLEVLTFKEMQQWENWTCSRIGEEEIEAFPSLHTLRIVQCPNLKGRLPNHLPCLENLIMHETEQWIASLPRLPSLERFDISGCTSHVLSLSSFSLLSSLQISEVSNFTHLRSEMVEGLQQLKHLQIMDCDELQNLCQDEFGLLHMSCLQSLIVRNCPLMTFLCNKLPPQLEYLELENCRNLVEMPRALHTVVSLRELTIKDCPNLTSFPPDTNFPVGLRGLMIRGCGLVSLPKEIMESDAANSLEYLYISGCYDLVSFPDTTEEQSFPPSLQQLTIDHCPNLSSLPDGMMQGSSNLFLKVLEIFDCSSVVFFPNGLLPKTLKTLTIFNCSSLESLSDILVNQDHSNNIDMVLESFRVGKCPSLRHLPNGMSRLSCLDYFEIEGCPGVVSFPEGGLPSTNLKKVHIINCENLSALPEGMQSLTSLEDLSISDCPRLLSLPVRGLPVNLVSLEIKGCDNISEMSDWGLHRLNSLKKLCLSGGKWNSSLSTFPEWLLSPTITSLQLGKLPKLDFESNWLHNLTALEDLKLKDCPHLPSLPLDKLPQTLSCLEISGCPLVEQQCVIEWEWIDHLPWVV